MSYNYEGLDYGDSDYGFSESTETPVAKIALSLTVCVVGLIGNALVIFVILVLKEYKKSVTHWYVLQLAIADSLFLLSLPFKVSEDLEGRWLFSQTLCKTKETILFLNYYASILFLVIMSVDRYIAVCQRFHKHLQKLRTNHAALIITGTTWVVALLICIPVMKYSYKVGHEPDCSCSYEFPRELNFTGVCLNEGYTSDNIQECLTFKQKMEDSKDKDEPYCTKAEYFQELFSSYYTGSENSTDGMPGFKHNEDYISYYDEEHIAMSSEVSKSTGGAAEPSFSPYCNYWGRPPSWSAFLIFNFVGMFIVPFIVMAVCHTLIIMHLKSTRVRLQSTGSETSQITAGSNGKRRIKSSSKSEKDRRRVTVMCCVLVGTFGVLWLPFHANHIGKIFGIPRANGDDTICKVLPIVGSILAYLNSALNPYLYSLLGGSFKRRLRSASTTVRGLTRNRRSSSTSGTVRYTMPNRGGSSGNDATAMENMEKGGTNSESSRPSFDAPKELKHDSKEMKTTETDKEIISPPQYEDVQKSCLIQN